MELKIITVNPLLSPAGWGLIYFKGGLNRGRGGLFTLGKTMVSVPYKELEYKVENLQYKKV